MIVMAQWLERRIAKILACCLIAFFLGPIPVFPQNQPGQEEMGPKPFSPEELEQIVAPVALYSDGLLAQVFMASTYPVELVQAARFQKANPNLTGDALSAELQKYDWDDSVKFMVTVPQALTMMDEKLDWTQKLGDAFLDQRKETMDAVQRLRAKAQKEGNLKTTPEQTVRVEPAAAPAAPPPPPPPPAPGQPVTAPPPAAPTQQTIVIEQANPQTVYVPTYNPAAVYGAWPYPAYPPYYYYPPGYALAGAAISFGIGMAVGGAIWGGCNWGGGDVDIDVNKSNNFNKNVNREGRQRNTTNVGSGNVGSGNRQSFQHNPEHRKGAQYRDSGTQQRYNKQGPAGAQNRQDYRGRGSGGAQTSDRAGAGGGRGDAGRGGGGAPSVSDRAGGGGGRGDFGGAGGGGNSAFQGMDRGGDARASSQRGQSSMGSSSRGGGGSSSFSGGGGRSGGGSSSFSGGGGGRSSGGGGGRSGGGGGGRSGGGGGGRR